MCKPHYLNSRFHFKLICWKFHPTSPCCPFRRAPKPLARRTCLHCCTAVRFETRAKSRCAKPRNNVIFTWYLRDFSILVPHSVSWNLVESLQTTSPNISWCPLVSKLFHLEILPCLWKDFESSGPMWYICSTEKSGTSRTVYGEPSMLVQSSIKS